MRSPKLVLWKNTGRVWSERSRDLIRTSFRSDRNHQAIHPSEKRRKEERSVHGSRLRGRRRWERPSRELADAEEAAEAAGRLGLGATDEGREGEGARLRRSRGEGRAGVDWRVGDGLDLRRHSGRVLLLLRSGGARRFLVSRRGLRHSRNTGRPLVNRRGLRRNRSRRRRGNRRLLAALEDPDLPHHEPLLRQLLRRRPLLPRHRRATPLRHRRRRRSLGRRRRHPRRRLNHRRRAHRRHLGGRRRRLAVPPPPRLRRRGHGEGPQMHPVVEGVVGSEHRRRRHGRTPRGLTREFWEVEAKREIERERK